MDNLLFGLSSIARGMQHTIFAIFQHQLAWGFVLGFFASTVIHALVSIEQPKHIPHILTKEKMKAFSSLATRDQSGTYSASYSKFDHEYHYIRSLFYTVLLSFLVVMIIATIRY